MAGKIPREKFSTKLIKFVARTVGLAAVALALVAFGSTRTGVLQWVLVGAGVVLFIGLALNASALSGETRRKLGALPLGEPGRDLDALPLTRQWREQRSEQSAQRGMDLLRTRGPDLRTSRSAPGGRHPARWAGRHRCPDNAGEVGAGSG